MAVTPQFPRYLIVRINHAIYKRTMYKEEKSKRSLLTETKAVGGGEDVELQRDRGREGKAPSVQAGRHHERSEEVDSKRVVCGGTVDRNGS